MVDFTTADVLDRKWWQKVNQIVDFLDRKNQAKILNHMLAQQRAVLDYAMPSDVFEHHWQQHQKLLTEYMGMITPWVNTTPMSAEESINRMRQTYTEVFGDPQSEEFKRQMQAQIDHWESSNRN